MIAVLRQRHFLRSVADVYIVLLLLLFLLILSTVLFPSSPDVVFISPPRLEFTLGIRTRYM